MSSFNLTMCYLIHNPSCLTHVHRARFSLVQLSTSHCLSLQSSWGWYLTIEGTLPLAQLTTESAGKLVLFRQSYVVIIISFIVFEIHHFQSAPHYYKFAV